MKRQYQIDKERAVRRFRSVAGASSDAIPVGVTDE